MYACYMYVYYLCLSLAISFPLFLFLSFYRRRLWRGIAAPPSFAHHAGTLPLLAAAREDAAYKRRKQIHRNAYTCACVQTKIEQNSISNHNKPTNMFKILAVELYRK